MSNFVLQAAMKVAEGRTLPPPRYTEEEANAIVRETQETFRNSRAYGCDLVEELLAERRTEAARESYRLRFIRHHGDTHLIR